MGAFIAILVLIIVILCICANAEENKKDRERKERRAREQQAKEEFNRRTSEKIIATSKEMLADERFQRFFSDIDAAIVENIDYIDNICASDNTLVIRLQEPKQRWSMKSRDESDIRFCTYDYDIKLAYGNPIDKGSVIYCILNRHSNFTYRCRCNDSGDQFSSRDPYLVMTNYKSDDEGWGCYFLYTIYKT